MLCVHSLYAITFSPKAIVAVCGRSSGLLNLSKSSPLRNRDSDQRMTKDNKELTAAGTVPVLHRILFSPCLMVIRNGNHEHLIAKVIFFIFILAMIVGFHHAIFWFENLPLHKEFRCSGLRAFNQKGAKIYTFTKVRHVCRDAVCIRNKYL